MGTVEITFITVWVVLSIVVGLYARAKGRSFVLYFGLSCCLTPLVVGLVVRKLKYKTDKITDSQNLPARPRITDDNRSCKKCGVKLTPGYSICPNCHCINLTYKE
jgi:uncharacterized membrane protein YhdT